MDFSLEELFGYKGSFTSLEKRLAIQEAKQKLGTVKGLIPDAVKLKWSQAATINESLIYMYDYLEFKVLRTQYDDLGKKLTF